MNFEFAKATDITDFVKEEFGYMYEDEVVRVYITPDTHDYHILRIVKGLDEDYEESEDSFLLEWNKIPKSRGSFIRSEEDLKRIIEEDDGSNWDVKEYYSLQECIDEIDGGYGFA
jgi:hypothetical protein